MAAARRGKGRGDWELGRGQACMAWHERKRHEMKLASFLAKGA